MRIKHPAILLLGCCFYCTAVYGFDPTILQNRTDKQLEIRFQQQENVSPKLTLAPNGSLPLSLTGSVRVWFKGPDDSGSGTLWPNNIYRLIREGQTQFGLQRLPLGGKRSAAPEFSRGKVVQRPPWVLRIKIAVDDDERTRREIWERKIQQRIAAASRLLEYYCGVQLKIVAVTRWESKDSIRDFNLSLSEFSAKVPASPARLVIGFTSQYSVNRGRQRLGGTRGPLRSHILIREHGPRIGESERLEVLLHELGHYFGAAHSPQQMSLMRPILGDDQSNARSFQMTYDPVNLLAMNLVSDQIRRPNFHSVRQIPLPVQKRLLDIYNWLTEQQPGDDSAENMAGVLCRGVLSRVEGPQGGERPQRPSAAELRARIESRKAVMSVLHALVNVADAREDRSLSLDRLTEAYVRAAAKAAAKLKKEHAQKAFYFALAIALDRGYLIKRYDAVAQQIQTDNDLVEAVAREKFVGKATIWRRVSLLQDFISAGLLAEVTGTEVARDSSTMEEIKQATEPAGFSFAAIAASRAGIRMQQALSAGEISLTQLADAFAIPRFVPSVEGLRKFWSIAELEEDFGGTDGIYFQREIEKIQQAVNNLPPYRVGEKSR